ncbi:hypothetical protein [uncultured Thiodictyon sp.]|uniref:hypothetical protein n=1 Tax=uncultured Thiodictyon sp. TaxID=1846217 RepID=UPI0025F6D94B|nr:hypothetical protein [uncultured Thiodictyon sp.]
MDLLTRLNDKQALIGILGPGPGYVGLPLILRFAEVGYRVLGLDMDQSKVDTLNTGQCCRSAGVNDSCLLKPVPWIDCSD